MRDPINWDDFLKQASKDAEEAAGRQLLEQATPDDFEAIRGLALIQLGMITSLQEQLAKTKADLAAVTMAANMNADTIREMQRRG